MGLWDRYAVPALVSAGCASKPIMKQREKVVPHAAGAVLEIGCGAGTNFAMYDPGKVERLFAVEPALGMINRAKRTVAAVGASFPIELAQTGAEAVPLDDGSIDTAVLTFVMCTIPEPDAAFAELRRVLKPGGQVLFSEHGLSPDPGVAKWQRRVEPVWKRLAGGCHITRDVGDMLRRNGFAADRFETMYLPAAPKIAGFVSWGSAKVA